MMVSTGLTVPVAVTVRATSPRATAASVYWTEAPEPDSHQVPKPAASSASATTPISQVRRWRGLAGPGGGTGLGTSVTGAGESLRAVFDPAGVFISANPCAPVTG